MATKRRSELITTAAPFAAPILPLGEAELAYLRRAMDETAPNWSVELEGICSQEATLVVVPEDGEDVMGPSFVISQETDGLRVNQLHWDVVTEVGVFASLGDVAAAMQVRLAFCTDTTVPASVTLH
jgi:hypothetical protein